MSLIFTFKNQDEINDKMDRTKLQSPNKILFTLFTKYSQNLTDTFKKNPGNLLPHRDKKS